MHPPALRHALFTNAPGPDGGIGYRPLFWPDGWAGDDSVRLISWIQGLMVDKPIMSHGWAFRPFRADGTVHACLVRVDDQYGPDRHGRGTGHMAHMIAAAVQDGIGKPPYLPKLVETHERVARTDGEVGDLEQLRVNTQRLLEEDYRSDVERWTAIFSLSRVFIGTLLQAIQTCESDEIVTFDTASAEALPRLLAEATTVLPPRLQLSARWAVGIQVGTDAGFSARCGGSKSQHFTREVEKYLSWCLSRYEHGEMDELEIVANDWEIRSWQTLVERIN